MRPATELDELGRIVIAIKTYRHQTGDYDDPLISESTNFYLKQHLSLQEWLLWQRLRTDSLATLPFRVVAQA